MNCSYIWQLGTCPQIGGDRSAGGRNAKEKELRQCNILSLLVLPVRGGIATLCQPKVGATVCWKAGDGKHEDRKK